MKLSFKKVIFAFLILFSALTLVSCKEDIDELVSITLPDNVTANVESLDYVIKGTSVTLEVNVPLGKELEWLKVDGEEVVVTNNKYTFTINNDVIVTVSFKDVVANIRYTLTLPDGVSSDVTDLSNINANTNVKLTITVPEGKVLDFLKINGEIVNVSNNEHTFVITKNTIVTVNFREPNLNEVNYKLTLPPNVTANVSNLDLILENSSVKLTVLVPEGKTLDWLKVDGVNVTVNSNNEYTFVITKNTVVTVNFKNSSGDIVSPQFEQMLLLLKGLDVSIIKEGTLNINIDVSNTLHDESISAELKAMITNQNIIDVLKFEAMIDGNIGVFTYQDSYLYLSFYDEDEDEYEYDVLLLDLSDESLDLLSKAFFDMDYYLSGLLPTNIKKINNMVNFLYNEFIDNYLKEEHLSLFDVSIDGNKTTIDIEINEEFLLVIESILKSSMDENVSLEDITNGELIEGLLSFEFINNKLNAITIVGEADNILVSFELFYNDDVVSKLTELELENYDKSHINEVSYTLHYEGVTKEILVDHNLLISMINNNDLTMDELARYYSPFVEGRVPVGWYKNNNYQTLINKSDLSDETLDIYIKYEDMLSIEDFVDSLIVNEVLIAENQYQIYFESDKYIMIGNKGNDLYQVYDRINNKFYNIVVDLISDNEVYESFGTLNEITSLKTHLLNADFIEINNFSVDYVNMIVMYQNVVYFESDFNEFINIGFVEKSNDYSYYLTIFEDLDNILDVDEFMELEIDYGWISNELPYLELNSYLEHIEFNIYFTNGTKIRGYLTDLLNSNNNYTVLLEESDYEGLYDLKLNYKGEFVTSLYYSQNYQPLYDLSDDYLIEFKDNFGSYYNKVLYSEFSEDKIGHNISDVILSYNYDNEEYSTLEELVLNYSGDNKFIVVTINTDTLEFDLLKEKLEDHTINFYNELKYNYKENIFVYYYYGNHYYFEFTNDELLVTIVDQYDELDNYKVRVPLLDLNIVSLSSYLNNAIDEEVFEAIILINDIFKETTYDIVGKRYMIDETNYFLFSHGLIVINYNNMLLEGRITDYEVIEYQSQTYVSSIKIYNDINNEYFEVEVSNHNNLEDHYNGYIVYLYSDYVLLDYYLDSEYTEIFKSYEYDGNDNHLTLYAKYKKVENVMYYVEKLQGLENYTLTGGFYKYEVISNQFIYVYENYIGEQDYDLLYIIDIAEDKAYHLFENKLYLLPNNPIMNIDVFLNGLEEVNFNEFNEWDGTYSYDIFPNYYKGLNFFRVNVLNETFQISLTNLYYDSSDYVLSLEDVSLIDLSAYENGIYSIKEASISSYNKVIEESSLEYEDIIYVLDVFDKGLHYTVLEFVEAFDGEYLITNNNLIISYKVNGDEFLLNFNDLGYYIYNSDYEIALYFNELEAFYVLNDLDEFPIINSLYLKHVGWRDDWYNSYSLNEFDMFIDNVYHSYMEFYPIYDYVSYSEFTTNISNLLTLDILLELDNHYDLYLGTYDLNTHTVTFDEANITVILDTIITFKYNDLTLNVDLNDPSSLSELEDIDMDLLVISLKELKDLITSELEVTTYGDYPENTIRFTSKNYLSLYEDMFIFYKDMSFGHNYWFEIS